MKPTVILTFLLGIMVGISFTLLFEHLNTAASNEAAVISEVNQEVTKSTRTPVVSRVKTVQRRQTQVPKSSLTLSLSSAENLKASLHYVSDSQLIDYALQTSIVDEATLVSFQQPREAIYRLIDIALKEKEPNEDVLTSNVMFSNTKPNSSSYSAQSEFPADVNTIYAFFDLTGYSHHTVLVKWFNESSNKIVLMKNLPIKMAETTHHIQVKKRLWNEGMYRVSIYSLDEEMPQLASGKYHISE